MPATPIARFVHEGHGVSASIYRRSGVRFQVVFRDDDAEETITAIDRIASLEAAIAKARHLVGTAAREERGPAA